MLSLRGLIDRAAGYAPPPVTIAALLPFNRNWKTTMLNIETKIAEAQDRRRALVAERDPLVVAYVEGDPVAAKQVDRLDRSIDDTERELSRLHIARGKAAERVAAEAKIEAEHRERDRLAKIRLGMDGLHKLAAKVDDSVDALHASLRALAGTCDEMRVAIGDSEAHEAFHSLSVAIPPLISERLSSTGYNFKRLPFTDLDKVSIASRMPDTEYVVSVAANAPAKV